MGRSAVSRLLQCCGITRGEKTHSEGPKTINIFIGFLFFVNFQMGTGFLGIPFAFFHGGLLAGAGTLVLASFVNWVTAIWVLETLSRAQAITEHGKSEVITASSLPIAAVLGTKRKFEVTELCGIFLGRWAKYIYLAMNTTACFLYLVEFSTVAGASWAVNLPLNFAGIEECNDNDFHFQILPSVVSCRNAYWFCLFLFGCIVVPLSMVELKEQAFVQITLSVLRFVTVGAIVIFCAINLIFSEEICTCDQPWGNTTANTDFDRDEQCNVTTSLTDILTRFNFEAWTLSIPVVVSALNMHPGIPFLTHPVKQKHQLGPLLHALFIAMMSVYMLVGIAGSMWWSECVNETCSLNWNPLTHPSYNLGLRMISYYILLFPSVDVISIFPLSVLNMVNNVHVAILGKDTADSGKTWKSFTIILMMKFFAGLFPILVAMAVSNLVTVLKYTGLISFFLCFLVPILLHIRSQWVCKKTFQKALHSKYYALLDKSADGVQPDTGERSKLMLSSKSNIKPSDLYLTPYSNIFSHWLMVVVTGLVCTILFALTIVSFFFHPKK